MLLAERKPVHKSVAWYEPYRYEPDWMKQDENGRKPGKLILLLGILKIYSICNGCMDP